jgi:hypothetical protein
MTALKNNQHRPQGNVITKQAAFKMDRTQQAIIFPCYSYSPLFYVIVA